MKTDITQEQWIKIKEQGKFKYLLFHWILTIAIPLGIFFPILRVLIDGNFSYMQFIINIIVNVMLFCAISIISGLRKWKNYRKMFN